MKTQLFKRLAEQIYADYASVGKLPGERSLGERYVASRATIRAALSELQQRGRLVSDARRGHTLIVEASPEAPSAPSAPPVRRSFNVVVFCGSRLIEDQAFLDFLGGVISSGSRAGVNVIVREIEEKLFIAGVEHAEQLYAGIEADGYILTFLSEGLRQFLERQLKPCVALGMADRIGELDKRRFIRVFLPQQEKVRLLFDRLTAQGHRRILVPCSEVLGKYICNLIPPGIKVDFVRIPFNTDSTMPRPEAGEAVMAALKDHTALLVPFGGATSLEIYRRLMESGVEIPRRLSVVIDSGRFDYFVRVFGIAGAYSSSREEGEMCMESLVRQLKSGCLEFGDRYAHYSYFEGRTVGPAMSPEEVKQYDSKRSRQK